MARIQRKAALGQIVREETVYEHAWLMASVNSFLHTWRFAAVQRCFPVCRSRQIGIARSVQKTMAACTPLCLKFEPSENGTQKTRAGKTRAGNG
jgi:hypothetical protein